MFLHPPRISPTIPCCDKSSFSFCDYVFGRQKTGIERTKAKTVVIYAFISISQAGLGWVVIQSMIREYLQRWGEFAPVHWGDANVNYFIREMCPVYFIVCQNPVHMLEHWFRKSAKMVLTPLHHLPQLIQRAEWLSCLQLSPLAMKSWIYLSSLELSPSQPL